jgi:hypothetical protein
MVQMRDGYIKESTSVTGTDAIQFLLYIVRMIDSHYGSYDVTNSRTHRQTLACLAPHSAGKRGESSHHSVVDK